MSDNPKMAVLIWEPASGDGYEILGEVLMFESQAYLNGFAPEVEENAYRPQAQRKSKAKALNDRRSIMETNETKDLTAAAAADTDDEADCMTDCCVCCCCDTEEECSMEA